MILRMKDLDHPTLNQFTLHSFKRVDCSRVKDSPSSSCPKDNSTWTFSCVGVNMIKEYEGSMVGQTPCFLRVVGNGGPSFPPYFLHYVTMCILIC